MAVILLLTLPFHRWGPVTSVRQFIHFVHGRPLLWLLQDRLAKRIAACLQFCCLSLCACLPQAVCLQSDFAACPAM